MRILVTGGLGFTGRAVLRTLTAHGHDVTALTSRSVPSVDLPDVTVAVADLRQVEPIAEVVRDGKFDAVCHLAALTRVRDSFADPLAYYDVNVAGTLHLLQALDHVAATTDNPAQLVFASTAAVYGPAEGRLTESQPTKPTNPYGDSKLAAEQLIAWQPRTGRLKATILRLFNIAGGFDGLRDPDTTRIIPKALAVANGEFSHVTVNGDGSALREYTHVLDTAEAFRLAVETPYVDDHPHRVYNVGTGVGVSIADVISQVRQLTGHPVQVEHTAPKPEPAVLLADPALIQKELGWVPALSTLGRILRDGWTAHASPAGRSGPA